MDPSDDGRSPAPDGPLLIASNRLPVRLHRDDAGAWSREETSGGLVTALEPVLRSKGGMWVGWPGVLSEDIEGEELNRVLADDTDGRYGVEPVPLSRKEHHDFYLGFSNEILWPLCHGLQSRCNFEPRYWETYRRVNSKFAEAICRVAKADAFIWVHDYHLMAVAEELRSRACGNPTGFFLHIPFPAPDTLEQLPWAAEVLDSLLSFDLVGFQTERDCVNFLDCVEGLPATTARVDENLVRTGRGTTRIGAFPISIDTEAFRSRAAIPEVRDAAEDLRSQIGTENVILGVDRLDYTKGIPQKLKGLERALEKYPELRERLTLVQLVVPSRENIPEYNRMKDEIERLVGRINGRFTSGGWAPILYQFGSWSQDGLLAFYRAADVGLVTSVRDGMNLVSKEFCAASVDGRGVLVLSAFAGSADELGGGAILVNPNDVDAVADAIHQACTMPDPDRRRRLESLQRQVSEWDVHRWVDDFREAVGYATARLPERKTGEGSRPWVERPAGSTDGSPTEDEARTGAGDGRSSSQSAGRHRITPPRGTPASRRPHLLRGSHAPVDLRGGMVLPGSEAELG